jgi:DNA helicase-2/ATP-dependent DNA helicase PcrA
MDENAPIPPWLEDIHPGQVSPLIESDEPIIRVQAGPGTGKTLGIRRRVLRLLHREGLNVEPERVLVCAFNRAIAKDLEREIGEQLEPHALALPVIKTVHALCADIARSDARLLLPHEIEEMIYDVRMANPSVNARYDRRQAKAVRALREHEAGLVDHPALMSAVRQWLADHGAGLVGDVPRRVEAAMRGGETISHSYDHVVVDEFQDLTTTEAKVVVALRAEGGHLVAVGDRKQSIYAFRGNAEKGLAALPELVKGDIADHPMDECWRCPQEIVDLANAVMALENEPLQPVKGPGGQLHVVHFPSPEEEVKRIAQEALKTYLARPTDKHLVLVTRRKWGYELRSAIRELDSSAPVETIFAEDVLESWPAREAFIFLSILADPNEPVALRDWVAYQEDDEGKGFKAPRRNAEAYLNLKERIGSLTVEKLVALRDEPVTTFRGRGRGQLYDRMHRLIDLLDRIDRDRPPSDVVADVFDPARWIDYTGPAADLARDDLGRLLAESEKLLDEDPNLEVLGRRLRYRIATREPLGEEPRGGIRIVTLWGAKGLTADWVYLVGLADEALPGPHDEDESGLELSEHLAEQRRLLYVSLTRARRCLVISRATKLRRGMVMALGLKRTGNGTRWHQDLKPCQFFEDVPQEALPASVSGASWVGITTA